MGQQSTLVGTSLATAEFRSELLGRLGLTDNASDEDVERVHDELVEFLELAPPEVRSWATAQSTDADEAYALLSGPAEHLAAALPSHPVASSEHRTSGTTRAAAARTTASPGPSAPVVTRAAVLSAFKPKPSKLWWAALPVVLAAVVFFVFNMGGGSSVPGVSGKPTNKPSAAASGAAAPKTVPVDPAKVTALMTKITANPKDVPSLLSLGDIYFAAADYKTSAGWQQKVLAIDPKNQGALLALGAARFNAGDAPAAKKQWLIAAKLYPKLAEVHYDLGFLYLSQTPPDTANVKVEWNKVIAIDPTSNVAKTVATHLKGLDNPAAPSPKK